VNPPTPETAGPARDRFGAAVGALVGYVLKAPLVVVLHATGMEPASVCDWFASEPMTIY